MFHEPHEIHFPVKKKDALEKLITHKNAHLAVYQDMCKGYQVLVDEATGKFSKMLEKEFATKEPSEIDHNALYGQAFEGVVKPRSREETYNEAIEMLRAMQVDVFDISQDNFRKWFRDKWSWKGQFAHEGELAIAHSSLYNERFSK